MLVLTSTAADTFPASLPTAPSRRTADISCTLQLGLHSDTLRQRWALVDAGVCVSALPKNQGQSTESSADGQAAAAASQGARGTHLSSTSTVSVKGRGHFCTILIDLLNAKTKQKPFFVFAFSLQGIEGRIFRREGLNFYSREAAI